jgi:hypothetical protein
MNMGRVISHMGIVSVCASALVLSGCLGSAEGEGFEEEVGETEQAMGLECAGAAATASFTGSADWVSVQTYSTPSCFKGVVVDVNNILKPGGVATALVYWADSVPTTQAACEASYIAADVFRWVSGSWSYSFSMDDHGVWNAASRRGVSSRGSLGDPAAGEAGVPRMTRTRAGSSYPAGPACSYRRTSPLARPRQDRGRPASSSVGAISRCKRSDPASRSLPCPAWKAMPARPGAHWRTTMSAPP